jgi:hypothetical protein
VGDVNGDGKLDVVVGNDGSFATSTVSVFLGRGDGTLAAGVDYRTGGRLDDGHPPGVGPLPVVLVDLDADGRLDVVAGNWSTNTVSVLLGQQDGTLAAAVDYPTGYVPVSLVAADVNRDGIADLATMNAASTASILLGAGDGTFAPNVDFAAAAGYIDLRGGGPARASLAAGDLNGDGRLDFVVASQAAGAVSVLLDTCGY